MKSKVRGILYILMAALFFAFMTTFVKLSGDLPTYQKAFFRNLVAMVAALFVLLKNHTPLKLGKGNLPLALIRSACGTLGVVLNFYAIDRLVLSDANMLNKLSPFFGVLFSAIFLKEKCKPVQLIGIIGAFIGSLFIIKPAFASVDIIGSVAGFLGGLCAGAAYTAVRALGNRGEKGPRVVFFFSAFSCIVLLPFTIAYYKPMSTMQWVYLLLAGASAAGGQFSITAAYFHAPASEISIYDYAQVIFTAILGFIIWNQKPDIFSIIGYIIICTMAVLMFLYTKKLKSEVHK